MRLLKVVCQVITFPKIFTKNHIFSFIYFYIRVFEFKKIIFFPFHKANVRKIS